MQCITEAQLQELIEPYLIQYNLSGYRVNGIIPHLSSEGIIYILSRPDSYDLIIKVKSLIYNRTTDIDDAKKEAIEMIRLSDNGNVVPILAHFGLTDKEPYLYCIVEKRYTVLFDYVNSGRCKDPIELAVRLCVDMCNVLYDCQNQNPTYRIIHRDIKFGNIFFDGNIEKGLLLGDFGIATDIAMTSVVSKKGTWTTESPEVMLRSDANHQSDIYSVGELMYFLLNGFRYRFSSEDEKRATLKKTSQKKYNPKKGSEKLKKIVSKALEKRLEDRWTNALEMFEAIMETDEFKRIYSSHKGQEYIRGLSVYKASSAYKATVNYMLNSEEEFTNVRTRIDNPQLAHFIYKGTVAVFLDDGAMYCGEWYRGHMHGNGEMLSSGGVLTTGQWDNGRLILVNEKRALRAPEIATWKLKAIGNIRVLYNKVTDKNIPDGDNVTVLLSSTAIYSGGWLNGGRQGEGWLVCKDQYISEGVWDKDCFCTGIGYYPSQSI